MNVLRKAIIEASCEALPDALPVLRDYGLVVCGSAPCDRPGVIRLIVGAMFYPDLLPAECDDGWRIVIPEFTQEAYGNQRLVRVSAINVVGQPALHLAA